MKNILKNERTQTIIACMNVSNETNKPIYNNSNQIKQRTNFFPSLHKQNMIQKDPRNTTYKTLVTFSMEFT